MRNIAVCYKLCDSISLVLASVQEVTAHCRRIPAVPCAVKTNLCWPCGHKSKPIAHCALHDVAVLLQTSAADATIDQKALNQMFAVCGLLQHTTDYSMLDKNECQQQVMEARCVHYAGEALWTYPALVLWQWFQARGVQQCYRSPTAVLEHRTMAVEQCAM